MRRSEGNISVVGDMAKKYDVYGVGNALVDLQVRASDSDLEYHSLRKGGMQLVDGAAQRKLTDYFDAQTLHRASGGSVANSVIAIAQLGGHTAYGCLVGDDTLGKFYHDEMADLGVHLHNAPMAHEPTGTSLILITPDAERTMNTNLGASALFGPEHVSEDAIRDARWLYIEGYLLSSETGRAAAKLAAAYARNHGTRIAVSFSDGFIVEVFGDALREVVESADLVFANKAEAQAYTGMQDEDEVFRALKNSAPGVVMTLHERGARLWYEGDEAEVPGVKTDAVDTTGAGDMFAGAFLYGITHGMGLRESGRLACFLASKVVSQVGPRILGDLRAIPGIEQVLP